MHNKSMEEPFDPYLHWLAIRDPRRPPNHYRLLGLDLFESDPEVILNAADRQMTHVRRFQGGKHSDQSQRLLNELAAAKICLLNAEKKAAYDAELRTEVTPELRVTTPPPIAEGMEDAAPTVSIPSVPLSLAKLQKREAESLPVVDLELDSALSPPTKPKGRFFSISIMLCIFAALAAILLGIFVLWSNANQKRTSSLNNAAGESHDF